MGGECTIKKSCDWIYYGLKFKQGKPSEKYKEAFPDGLVPAVFHPNAKESTVCAVRIINKSAVSDDILFDGAKFSVEDNDGIFIAEGTVVKSKLDL